MKPGDDIRWTEVPDGAMVMDDEGDLAVRIRGMGTWVRESITGDAIFGGDLIGNGTPRVSLRMSAYVSRRSV